MRKINHCENAQDYNSGQCICNGNPYKTRDLRGQDTYTCVQPTFPTTSVTAGQMYPYSPPIITGTVTKGACEIQNGLLGFTMNVEMDNHLDPTNAATIGMSGECLDNKYTSTLLNKNEWQIPNGGHLSKTYFRQLGSVCYKEAITAVGGWVFWREVFEFNYSECLSKAAY